MSLPDIVNALGVIGVLLVIVAYAGATTGRMDATKAPALLLNLIGSMLILWSLFFEFNLSAVLMEGAWALVAVIGLLRLAFARKG
ncbi:MAG: hypothetical protein EON87_13450 [Brevundimonas sp.]|nr:MAG: hypothetical protein EON87_13450 [Brevundimonas sp.]